MNKPRDQFLVEQEGGDTTQQYGCYSDYSYEAMPCVIDTGERHNCVFASKGIEKTQCKNWVAVPVLPTDFSKWENFGRLSKIAMDNRIGVHFNPNSNPNRIEYRLILDGATHGMVNIEAINYDSIPNIIATLIAQKLGWKEEV